MKSIPITSKIMSFMPILDTTHDNSCK